MQLVALPTDERSRPRTQADYGEPYSSSYAESEKEYLSALAKSLSDYGKPGADPLAMPIDIGVANITKPQLAFKMSNIPEDIQNVLNDLDMVPYGGFEKASAKIKGAANTMLKRVPTAVTDFIDDFKYRSVDDKVMQELMTGAPSAGWHPLQRLISVSPASVLYRPKSYVSPTHMTGHEIGHAAMQLLRSILGEEDKVISAAAKDKTYKVANKHKLNLWNRDEIMQRDIEAAEEKGILFPYASLLDSHGYKNHPEERVAEAYAQTITNLSDAQRVNNAMSGYVSPELDDFMQVNIINRLLKSRK
jgi:hypothetical protein